MEWFFWIWTGLGILMLVEVLLLCVLWLFIALIPSHEDFHDIGPSGD